MWKGRPVVASRVGGLADQVTHGVDGLLLVDPGDLPAFGAAVRSLLDDPEPARVMGCAAHEHVRRTSLGAHSLLRYLDLLTTLDGRAAEGRR
jgi:trehalose synthase